MEHIKCWNERIYVLIISAFLEPTCGYQMVTQNALAILDLRLERWLDVVVPMPAAFEDMTQIGFDAEGRLCSFCIATREPTAMKIVPSWHRSFIDSKRSSIVTWRGPIGYVKMKRKKPVKGAF